MLRPILRLILSVTAHDAVCTAIIHPNHIEPLLKQLTDVRKTSLAMVSGYALISGQMFNVVYRAALCYVGVTLTLHHPSVDIIGVHLDYISKPIG